MAEEVKSALHDAPRDVPLTLSHRHGYVGIGVVSDRSHDGLKFTSVQVAWAGVRRGEKQPSVWMMADEPNITGWSLPTPAGQAGGVQEEAWRDARFALAQWDARGGKDVMEQARDLATGLRGLLTTPPAQVHVPDIGNMVGAQDQGSSSLPAMPEGWVVMPRKMTEAMISASGLFPTSLAEQIYEAIVLASSPAKKGN